ncbi:MAG: class I SAM-dependent methyltransferase [Gemmatimonadetes bacterium]|nr:class I SAM-dependent methyltransferase [Gemmatimonadota bacterium]
MAAILDRVVKGLQERYVGGGNDGRPAIALRTEEGPLRVFGGGEPQATLVVRTRAGLAALASMDHAAAAEAYVAGDLDVDGDLTRVLALRDAFTDRHPLAYLMRFVKPLVRGQVRADRSAIPEHYDRDPEFFLSFLDTRHRCYSHGFFAHADEPLEDAITRKLDFALEAVNAKPGDRILDIGGGWGAMAEHAGRRGIRVTSLTISEPSRRFIADLIARQMLPCEVRMEHFFEHRPAEPYDGIVNLGVTEHLPDYARTLAHYDALLKPGGKVYLDASAGRKKYDVSAFLERHIYRGNGSLLCLHQYLQAVAASPWEPERVGNDRDSYGLTTRHWAMNLDRARDRIEARWGTAVYRLFRLYLWGCTDAFERGLTQAYHLILRRGSER